MKQNGNDDAIRPSGKLRAHHASGADEDNLF